MMDFFNSQYPKARKKHTCDLCNQEIRIGEKYHRYSGKYEGDMFDSKYHLTCQRIINAYCEAENDNEYNNDCIEDWLHDTYCIDCEHSECDCEQIFNSRCPAIRKHYMQEDKQ